MGRPLSDFDVLPPHDEDAEACTVSSLALGDADVRAGIRATVAAGDFNQAEYQTMFTATCDLIDQGQAVDMVTLRAELERRKVLNECGGDSHLAAMLTKTPSAFHGRHYAEIVRERSVRRKLIALADTLRSQCYEPPWNQTADEIAQNTAERLSAIIGHGRSATYWTVSEALEEVIQTLETGETTLVPTGINTMDAPTGGVGIGEMLIIAARPSMGKSTLLRQIWLRAARAGIPTGLISLEEGKAKIGRNILAAECGVDNHRLRKGGLGPQEWEEVLLGKGRIESLPMYGTDRARRIQDIRAIVALWASQKKVKLVIVDYLQRVRGAGGKDRYEQVSNISTELSDLFKEVGVAGIVAAQLNRAVEHRDDKRPTMSDLRDSGQIEQDADAVLFLHRPDYYHLDDEMYIPTGEAELIVAKWRDGIRGQVWKMQSDLRHQCFVDR